ncbi:MAG: glycosyltransferase family 87 protein [Tepidisphaeraceae bacterium]
MRTTAWRVRAGLWLALAGISLASFLNTLGDARRYPGTDLRARVVGAREMLRGFDPYFIAAKTDQTDTLQDPDRYAAVCSRCTYSPTLLYLYAPLANLPYGAQRYIWFAAEWCALAGSIILLRGTIRDGLLKHVFTAVAVLFFADGPFWRLHLERGQYYVFILFLFSLTARFCLGKSAGQEEPSSADRWWHGVPLGLAAAMRLTPLAALLPLWVMGLRRTAAGAAIVAIICIAGSIHFAGFGLWQSYFRAASIQSQLVSNHGYLESERARLPPLPASVEGMTFKRVLDLPDANVTFAAEVLRPLADRFCWALARDHWPTISQAGAVLICLLFPAMLRFRPTLEPGEKLAAALLCVLSAEFFLPVRLSYCDVMFLAPIGLLMPRMFRNSAGCVCFTIVLLGLALSHTLLPAESSMPILRPPLVMGGLLGYLAIGFGGGRGRITVED